MGAAKGRKRIESRLADKTVHPQPEPTPEPWLPNLEDCTEDAFVLDLGADDRLVVRTNEDPHGQLVEFALMQQTRSESGEWVEVLRADTKHSEVHVHRFNRSGGESREVLVTITGPRDVQRGYDDTYTTVLAEWNDNVRRWRDG